MYKYKTVDGSQTGVVPGIGEIKDGFIESETRLESPNLQLANADDEPQTPAAPAVPYTPSQQLPGEPPKGVHTPPADPALATTQTNNGDITS